MKYLVVVRLTAVLFCVLLSGCFESKDFGLSENDLNAILNISTVDGNQIPADGFSSLSLVAQISPSNSTFRTLTFSSSDGVLISSQAGSAPPSRTLLVQVDSLGSARVFLRSSQTVGQVTVRVEINSNPVVSRTINLQFTPPSADGSLQFSSVPLSLPADGVTRAQVVVTINPAAQPPPRTVAYSTNLGGFTATQAVLVDVNNQATNDLVAGTASGSARITATYAGVTRQSTVAFSVATPDRIFVNVTPVQVTASATSSALISVRTARDRGRISAGQVPLVRAFRSDTGAAVGSVRSVSAIDSDGAFTATYLPGVTDYRGNVIIEAGVEGSSVTGREFVSVISP